MSLLTNFFFFLINNAISLKELRGAILVHRYSQTLKTLPSSFVVLPIFPRLGNVRTKIKG
jgi:hypothetical protein